jgi:hypothetical protein
MIAHELRAVTGSGAVSDEELDRLERFFLALS